LSVAPPVDGGLEERFRSLVAGVLPRPVKVGFVVDSAHKAVLQHMVLKLEADLKVNGTHTAAVGAAKQEFFFSVALVISSRCSCCSVVMCPPSPLKAAEEMVRSLREHGASKGGLGDAGGGNAESGGGGGKGGRVTLVQRQEELRKKQVGCRVRTLTHMKRAF